MTAEGMYAPLTSSGTLLVDGVAASTYGTPDSGKRLIDRAAHAAFFAVRACQGLASGNVKYPRIHSCHCEADGTPAPFGQGP
jgi:hypothetical protein